MYDGVFIGLAALALALTAFVVNRAIAALKERKYVALYNGPAFEAVAKFCMEHLADPPEAGFAPHPRAAFGERIRYWLASEFAYHSVRHYQIGVFNQAPFGCEPDLIIMHAAVDAGLIKWDDAGKQLLMFVLPRFMISVTEDTVSVEWRDGRCEYLYVKPKSFDLRMVD